MLLNCCPCQRQGQRATYHRAYKSHVRRQAAIIGNPISHTDCVTICTTPSQISTHSVPCPLSSVSAAKNQALIRRFSCRSDCLYSPSIYLSPPPQSNDCCRCPIPRTAAHQSAWKSNNLFRKQSGNVSSMPPEMMMPLHQFSDLILVHPHPPHHAHIAMLFLLQCLGMACLEC